MKIITSILRIGLLALVSCPLCRCSCQEPLTDLQKVKKQYRQLILQPEDRRDTLRRDWVAFQEEHGIAVPSDFDRKEIEFLLDWQMEDGSWPDVNYQDTSRSGWSTSAHADRIEKLAKVYYAGPRGFRHSGRVKETIHKALDYWFTTKPVCRNWWWNQIGIPRVMGRAFLMLEDQLTPSEHAHAVELLKRAKFGRTGQNKVWLAGIVLVRALLENDDSLALAARNEIASEIVVGNGEGIQPDWSYHQHGAQQQFGNYGMSYIMGMALYHKIFEGTSYAFSQEQTTNLTSLLDEGYRWILWHRYMDVPSLDRQVGPDAQFTKAYNILFTAADFGMGGFPKSANPLVGHKHFEDSDYTIHRMKDWMASVKMASNRVIGTELINEDCPQGFYMGDGATYFYLDGDEYYNIFPFWDWRRIPGVTSFQDSTRAPNRKARNRTDLVGGLTDGLRGFTAMELDRDGLSACKAWLFTEDFVYCLGTGIRSESPLPVSTTVNQCIRRGNLEVLREEGWTPVAGRMDFSLPELRLWHDRIGYVITEGCGSVEAGERTGSWKEAMGTLPDTPVSGETALISIDHGVQPRDGRYAYFVLPGMTKDAVRMFDPDRIRVIRNDREAQILSVDGDEECWMALYRPGRVEWEDSRFEAEAAGIYHLKKSGDGWTVMKSHLFRNSR